MHNIEHASSNSQNNATQEKHHNSLLVAKHLHKSFSGREVVKDVSLEVAAGEIVGLLGPNGAGKSTSFNMVAGLLRPDRGEVLLAEASLAKLPLHERARRGLGYLPQKSTIFQGLSVLDNFRAYYEAKGLGLRASLHAARKLTEEYGLGHVAHSLGSQLSGGEARRVEMARSLIPEPKVVLLDEPFAGVDPIAVGDIKTFIYAMRDQGIGVLLTDHNVRETLSLCDRAFLIFEGKILLSGSAETIVNDPEARRVYLGEHFQI